MVMSDESVRSVTEYVDRTQRIRHYSGHRHIFRGVGSTEFELKPGIGWIPMPTRTARHNAKDGREVIERDLLEAFISRSPAYVAQRPASLLEVMFIAQHHGLPTRLLDWTFNPLVALFFAVADRNPSTDAVVYSQLAFNLLSEASDRNEVAANPLAITKDFVVVPPYIDARMTAQQSCFTLHSQPTVGIDRSRMGQIRIAGADKLLVFTQLHNFGQGDESLFPGLDGICRSLRFDLFGPSPNVTSELGKGVQ
jgi:FRG domain